ncbi:MAG: DUF493 domain-containing protein [Gammaproteobacteria bacterium]|nr:DUF493 domain-containing protein [Gammaproteobacteria bacterium]
MTAFPTTGVHSPQELNGKNAQFQSDLKFPRIVEIKIFLKAADDGETQVRALLCEKCPEEGVISITCRLSKKGNYHSFTCRLWIASKTELVQLYDYLGSQEQVLYLL